MSILSRLWHRLTGRPPAAPRAPVVVVTDAAGDGETADRTPCRFCRGSGKSRACVWADEERGRVLLGLREVWCVCQDRNAWPEPGAPHVSPGTLAECGRAGNPAGDTHP